MLKDFSEKFENEPGALNVNSLQLSISALRI
jgi:hypothetical protein